MRPAPRRACLAAFAAGTALLAVVACAILWRAFTSQEPPPTPAAALPGGSPSTASPTLPELDLAALPTPLPAATQPIFADLYLPALHNSAAGPALPEPPVPSRIDPYPPPAELNWVETALASMSLEQKVGQLIITGIPQPGYEPSPEACAQVEAVLPAGVTFQWDNVFSPDQLRALTASLVDCLSPLQPVPPFFALAHEGQYVHRFDQQVTTFPAALAIGASGDSGLAYQAGLASGGELAYSGINLVLGPVADVLINLDNEVVSMRTYGGDPRSVSDFVGAVTAGYVDAGLIPVLKHFPGHGGVAGDTHKTLVIDPSSLDEIRSFYLPPFQAGLASGAQVVMLSHVAYPAISGQSLPATISPEVPAFLRGELGFEGVILSDALDMKGIINGGLDVPHASLAAISAGVDLLLLNDPVTARQAYQLILSAAQDPAQLPPGRLEDAVRRVLQVKYAAGLHQPALLPAEPAWPSNAALAFQAGHQAVTLLRDSAGLVPLPRQYARLLLIGPTTDEGWDAHSQYLDPALQQAGFQVEHIHYLSLPNRGAEDRGALAALARQAPAADLLLVFTWQAYLNQVSLGDDYQVQLAAAALDTGKPVLFVALRSPTDVLAYPGAESVLATFGTTPGALSALADLLLGQSPPLGVNPLPGLP